MTGYTVHTGSTKKFATNWDQIFTKKGANSAATPAKSATPKATKVPRKGKGS